MKKYLIGELSGLFMLIGGLMVESIIFVILGSMLIAFNGVMAINEDE